MTQLGGGVLRFVVVSAVCACGGAGGSPPEDSGVETVPDASVTRVDAGRIDGGVSDGGSKDGGVMALDAGTIYDPGHCLRVPNWNVVVNASFECTALTPWGVSYGTGSIVAGGHADAKALQIVADAQGEGVVGQNEVVADSLGQVHCARVWVHGTSPDMRLEVRASPSGKGTAFSSPLASDAWVAVPPGAMMTVTSPRGESLSILAKMQGADAGDTLVVDDVQLWPSASGHCDEH